MLREVKIKKKYENGFVDVYDIHVPDVHHYILDNGVVSHNSGFIYASSIVVAIQKRKLKEDEDGKKVTDVRGIRAACKIMKTRYNKPFETVEIKIPWDTGMNPYSGLVDLFEKKGALVKDGNKLLFTASTGDQVKMFRSEWENNKHNMLDIIMGDFERFEKNSTLLATLDSVDEAESKPDDILDIDNE